MKKCERMILILALLMDGAKVRTTTLAQGFHVTPRSIQRDIEELRKYGIPILRSEGSYRLGEISLSSWGRDRFTEMQRRQT